MYIRHTIDCFSLASDWLFTASFQVKVSSLFGWCLSVLTSILLSIYHAHFLNAARLKLLNVRRIINYWFWYHNIIGFDNITDVHYKWSFILLNTYTIGFFISTFRLSGLEKWIYNASGFNYHQQLCYCNAVNSIILQCSSSTFSVPTVIFLQAAEFSGK